MLLCSKDHNDDACLYNHFCYGTEVVQDNNICLYAKEHSGLERHTIFSPCVCGVSDGMTPILKAEQVSSPPPR